MRVTVNIMCMPYKSRAYERKPLDPQWVLEAGNAAAHSSNQSC